jgi:hypothetical protein
MNELRCRVCGHRHTKEDPVIGWWIGGMGEVPQCLDTQNCMNRLDEGIQEAKESRATVLFEMNRGRQR